jgi:hypothetical protein
MGGFVHAAARPSPPRFLRRAVNYSGSGPHQERGQTKGFVIIVSLLLFVIVIQFFDSPVAAQGSDAGVRGCEGRSAGEKAEQPQ